MQFKSKKAKALVALVGGLVAIATRATADNALDLSDLEANGAQLVTLLVTAWAVYRVPNAPDPAGRTGESPLV